MENTTGTSLTRWVIEYVLYGAGVYAVFWMATTLRMLRRYLEQDELRRGQSARDAAVIEQLQRPEGH